MLKLQYPSLVGDLENLEDLGKVQGGEGGDNTTQQWNEGLEQTAGQRQDNLQNSCEEIAVHMSTDGSTSCLYEYIPNGGNGGLDDAKVAGANEFDGNAQDRRRCL